MLLPVRIETRFKGGDLWVRVFPTSRGSSARTSGSLRSSWLHCAGTPTRRPRRPPSSFTDPATTPPAWRALAAAVGAPRAVLLVRAFVEVSPDGSSFTVPDPHPDQVRHGPLLPQIQGFPSALQVWLDDGAEPRLVRELEVLTDRLLPTFADPAAPDERRWWEDWDEAVSVGVACVIPAQDLTGPVSALYVTGLSDSDPATLFADLAAEGRLGLLAPGQPTNSVDGAAAATLATDAAHWWDVLTGAPGPGDLDVSSALTGDPWRLGNLPGGDRPQRSCASDMTTVLWPALWGFAAGQVFDIARGSEPAAWAASAMFPEGAWPTLRVGPQPYALMPVTVWRDWQAADGDPALEASLSAALLPVRVRLAELARARGTAIGTDTDGLLDLIADTPSSSHFRYRQAWPLELWWMSSAGSGLPATWARFDQVWRQRHPLVQHLSITPLRRYGTRGPSRRSRLPLVVPPGVPPNAVPGLLEALADAARATPAQFARTATVEQAVLGGHGSSLLLRLAIRSLQLVIGDRIRERSGRLAFDPEPLLRADTVAGRLEGLVASAQAESIPGTDSSGMGSMFDATLDALRGLAQIPVPELERMLRAAVDCSSHRIDPWLLALPQRRLDTALAAGTVTRRLGAYGWVDAPAPGDPGPTASGVIHAPTMPAAMTAAVLRDRAISDPSPRWDLDIDSRTARTAEQIAAQVRAGAHLFEVVGREVERVVGHLENIAALRRQFPVRPEHAGRRTCDGVSALAAQPFPVTVTADQEAALTVLRRALDCYADLLVADAVHHLVEGRAETAGQVMDAAAGLSRPPELALLHTPRAARAVSSSFVLALPHVAGLALPGSRAERALLSPATVLDPSMAAAIAAHSGDAAVWDFVVGTDQPVTVTLDDLGLTPADALSLTLSALQRLALEHAGRPDAEVVAGAGPGMYDRAVTFVGLAGRDPALDRSFSDHPSQILPGAPADPEIVSRYASVRSVAEALAGELDAVLTQLGLADQDGELIAADADRLRILLRAAAGWGVAPDRAAGLVVAAQIALELVNARLSSAPDEAAAGGLSRERLSSTAVALISPTGQAGLTAAIAASAVGDLAVAPGLDDEWLTVVAAVRSAAARLEAHQLASGHALVGWANRPDDPWQTRADDDRSLVAVYAPPGLTLDTLPADGLVAATVLDRVDEVIPASEQTSGAVFGFDAPHARAQQAILLAVPPVPDQSLDPTIVARMLSETRELAHARMVRPVDLDPQLQGLLPTGLLPAVGGMQIDLEV